MKTLARILAFVYFRIYRILCRFGFHQWRTLYIDYTRHLETSPHLKRVVIRHRYQLCTMCLRIQTLTDKATVAHDWQCPERLFPKETNHV